MLIFIHTAAINVDHVIRAQFTPGSTPQLRLYLTEMEPAGWGPEGTMTQARLAFTGEEAVSVWLALRDEVSDAAANLRSVRTDCPHDWQAASEGRAAQCSLCFATTGAAAIGVAR